MKARFLDLHNCHELLPKGNGLPLMAKLDECLQWINNKSGSLNGSIDDLVERNEKTIGVANGVKRLCNSPIEIMQNSSIENRIVNTQAVVRKFPGPARYHIALGFENGMAQKATIPLQFLLKGWGDASSGHQCYIHAMSHDVTPIKSFEELTNRSMSDTGTYYYVGITGRNWLVRLEEHIREMRQGNRRLFYTAWREKYGADDVLFASFLSDINLSFTDAMNWEEITVDKLASDEYGLNMIPGGYKGLKVLYKCRIIKCMDISLEEREQAIAKYIRINPRKGIPNPYLAELWESDAFYLKVIEAKKKTLKVEQVIAIRVLFKQGKTIKQIAVEVNALNEMQVKNVVYGRTYRRIK